MKNFFETKLTNFVNAYTDYTNYQGPSEFTLKTECLMEFGDTLLTYFEINIKKEKLENPGEFDPDFMCFLNSVKNTGDYYEVTYIIDTTLKVCKD